MPPLDSSYGYAWQDLQLHGWPVELDWLWNFFRGRAMSTKIALFAALLSLVTFVQPVCARGGGHSYSSHSSSSHSSRSPVSVRGYTNHSGTYVAPYHRSAPDHSKLNNWSTRGNVNPYTGKVGTKDPNGH